MNITTFRRSRAFTLVEMLTVITIILILAAVLLNVAGYVQNKSARSRAQTEIGVIAAALENFKADNGDYPKPTIDPNSPLASYSQPGGKPGATNLTEMHYQVGLYEALAGDGNDARGSNIAVGTGGGKGAQGKNYMDVAATSSLMGSWGITKPNQPPVAPGGTAQTYNVGCFRDPWGAPYYYNPGDVGVLPGNAIQGGYPPSTSGSTKYVLHNPGSYDLFSNAGVTFDMAHEPAWVKNW
jgi:prepilin-type N-terminal cleavage/methylation domain-containing protein